jgi:hypothetical protein
MFVADGTDTTQGGAQPAAQGAPEPDPLPTVTISLTEPS